MGLLTRKQNWEPLRSAHGATIAWVEKSIPQVSWFARDEDGKELDQQPQRVGCTLLDLELALIRLGLRLKAQAPFETIAPLIKNA